MASNWDQRWVRSTPDGFKSANSGLLLCNVCGDREVCRARHGLDYLLEAEGVNARVETCRIFVPVIGFKDETGLDQLFNTFRRGQGWFKRLSKGARVRFATDAGLLGHGRVIETHSGELGALLAQHASMNHLMRDAGHNDPAEKLASVLTKLYGRNYAAPDAVYSVIYCQPD